MIQLKPQEKWPPLVGADNIPALLLIRDTTLTLCAWMLLGYLLRDFIYLSWDYLSHPIFELTASTAPDWQALWLRLRPFAGYGAVLVAWLLFWGIASRKTLSASKPKPQPPALTTDEHAYSLCLPANEVRLWQTRRSQTAHFDSEGGIQSVVEHYPTPASKA